MIDRPKITIYVDVLNELPCGEVIETNIIDGKAAILMFCYENQKYKWYNMNTGEFIREEV